MAGAKGRLCRGMAEQAAVAIENARLFDEREEAHLGLTKALAAAIDARDPYTHGHSRRVTKYAVAIGREMGLDAADLRVLRRAALLHDVGKIGTPDAILRKPTGLTEEEYAEVQKHPAMAVEMLKKVGFLLDEVPYILHHHERWSGGGYPDGLAGEEIPLGARILAVADTLDAMTSDRPYRPGMTLSEARKEIETCAGTQFDPNIADVASRLLRATPDIVLDESHELQPASVAAIHSPPVAPGMLST